MTQELITPRQGKIGGVSCQVVNGRDLHRYMELRSTFPNWMQIRIKQYGFKKDLDFELRNKIISQPSGAKHSVDYLLTLDTAKELAMVERNDKGREARRYFIDCERRLYSAVQPALPDPGLQQPVTAKMLLDFLRWPTSNATKIPGQNRLIKMEADVTRDHLAEVIEDRNRLQAEAEELEQRLLHLETENLSLFRENRDLLHFKVSVLEGGAP